MSSAGKPWPHMAEAPPDRNEMTDAAPFGAPKATAATFKKPAITSRLSTLPSLSVKKKLSECWNWRGRCRWSRLSNPTKQRSSPGASNRFATLPCPLGSVLLTPYSISTTYPCARLRPPAVGGQRPRLSRWFAFAPATVPPLAPCCAATVATPADGTQAAVRPPGLHRHGASLHTGWLVVPRVPSTHDRCSTTHPVPRASAVAASPPVLAAAATP
jgi:hypothetical protein